MVVARTPSVNLRPTPGGTDVAHGTSRGSLQNRPATTGFGDCPGSRFEPLLHSGMPARAPESGEPMLKLYTYFRSSAAFRVRIALNFKNLPWDPEVIWLPAGEQAGPAYQSVNPQALVPLLIEDGHHLAQSMAIIEYLDETHPEPRLLPGGPRDRARIRSLAQLVACDIHPVNNLRILKYLKREMGQTQEAIDNWYRHWCAEGLAAYERQMGDGGGGSFSHGDQPTLADICLVPQIFNAQRFDVDMTRFPKVAAVFERCMALPAFDAAQPSRQPEADRAPA
jgi:maleylpyruvate isomerase